MSTLNGSESRRADDLVGTQHECLQIAQSLADGSSVVLVGPLGSGKSHLVRSVVGRLRRAGVEPLVLGSGGPLSDVPLGAIDATRDPRARSLRTGSRNGDEPRQVVIIDDAQDLDDASAEVLVRAVLGGHATALFALTVSHDGSPAPGGGGSAAARMAVDLWLRGLAERFDLPGLTPAESDELLVVFGGGDLDALTRATVVALSDGSRMLLREFTREAVLAVTQGRDPIAAVREPRPYSRVADAIAAHVAQIPPEKRRVLATLDRVPRIAFADAVRIVPAEVLESLIAARLVYDDHTADRLLTANIALARGCDRVCAPDDIAATLGRAARAMLSSEADWWSIPLARRIASGWMRGEASCADPQNLSDDVRMRLAVDVSRSANDSGDHDLASWTARWGLSFRECLDLRMELLFADAGRGEPIDVLPVVEGLAKDELDCTSMLRWARMSSPLVTGQLATASGTIAAMAEMSCTEPRQRCEIDVLRAQMCAEALDGNGALALAVDLTTRIGASASVRMRAAVIAALAHASLGDADEAHKWSVRVRRLAGERDGVQPTTTRERLWVFGSEIMMHAAAGTDARSTLTRLEEEYRAAALEGDASTGSLAGLVAAAAAATTGDAERAHAELRAALRRPHPAEFATMAAYTEMFVACALAMHGRPTDARTVLDLVDTTMIETIPLLEHTRLSAEACVLASEGRDGDALVKARAATAMAEPAPVLLARDLFLSLVLGESDDRLLARLRRIAENTSVPVTRVLDDRARELVAARTDHRCPSSLDALRMLTPEPETEAHPDRRRRAAHGPHGSTGRLTPGIRSALQELTRREREIAMLVSEGLSNREIATRLYLSVRTVESHIYQARAKVDVGSRGELGALVSRASEGLSGR